MTTDRQTQQATIQNYMRPPNFAAATNSFIVPAIRYSQGGRTFYVITLSYAAVGNFVKVSKKRPKGLADIIDEEIINRFLDPKHVKEMKEYMRKEKEPIFPGITVAAFERPIFQPIQVRDFDGNVVAADTSDQGAVFGHLFLSLDTRFICLDGNHRVKTVTEVVEEGYNGRNNNLVVQIIEEDRPMKIRQDFVDINKNAKPTSPSINTFFDTRNPLSRLTVEILEDDETNWIRPYVDMLKTQINANSQRVYTLNNLKNAIVELSGLSSTSNGADKLALLLEDDDFKDDFKSYVIEFMDALRDSQQMQTYLSLETTKEKSDKKGTSALLMGTGLVIAASVGGQIIAANKDDKTMLQTQFRKLFSIDWDRTHEVFQGTLVSESGKIINSRSGITETTEELTSYYNLV